MPTHRTPEGSTRHGPPGWLDRPVPLLVHRGGSGWAKMGRNRAAPIPLAPLGRWTGTLRMKWTRQCWWLLPCMVEGDVCEQCGVFVEDHQLPAGSSARLQRGQEAPPEHF